jgi:glyoxylase-like metal-dependent hydrolase (beta-lactamase superfamily II)
MSKVPFVTKLDFEYEVIQTVSPLVRRIVARNPGPFTAQGTGTYIVGHGHVAIIDPGPLLTEHIDAILAGLGKETIDKIVITHTHLDHSPAAFPVKKATGAVIHGYGPQGAGGNETSEEGADDGFRPDVTVRDGDVIAGPGWTLQALHTPGHASNHICYVLAEEKVLFSGDHVMGWSTTVVSPPDGSMADYMKSLARLLDRDDRIYLPTHGPSIQDPATHVRALIAHREERRAGILNELAKGPRTIPEIVTALYIGLDPRLKIAAAHSVLAHIIELVETGQVKTTGAPAIGSTYARTG